MFLVGALVIVNMVVHRFLGSSIDPPFFSAFWFAITLGGLMPKDAYAVASWHKRAIYAVVVGTIIGWISYIEVISVP